MWGLARVSLTCTCLEWCRGRMGSSKGTLWMLSWTYIWGHNLPGQEMVIPGHSSAIPDLSYLHFASPLTTHVSGDLLRGQGVWALWYHCSKNWKHSEMLSMGRRLNKWRLFTLWNTMQPLNSTRDLSLPWNKKNSKTYCVLEQHVWYGSIFVKTKNYKHV